MTYRIIVSLALVIISMNCLEAQEVRENQKMFI